MSQRELTEDEHEYIEGVVSDTLVAMAMPGMEDTPGAFILQSLVDAIGMTKILHSGVDAMALALMIEAITNELSGEAVRALQGLLARNHIACQVDDFIAGVKIGAESILPNLDPNRN